MPKLQFYVNFFFKNVVSRSPKVNRGQKLLFQDLFQLIQLSPTLAGLVIADTGGWSL